MHLIYDNDEATGFIRQYVSQEVKNNVTDDDIDYIVSLVFNYYDQDGFLEDNTNEETIIEIDEEDIIAHVLGEYQKSKKNNTNHRRNKINCSG